MVDIKKELDAVQKAIETAEKEEKGKLEAIKKQAEAASRLKEDLSRPKV